jgi:FkbM family methyltransferase
MLAAPPKARIAFECRPKTQDATTASEVLRDNCYAIPEWLRPTDRIIDGGAHIGSFTTLCSLRGAGLVHAYEPDVDNFHFLCRNTAALLGVHRHKAALWRSDRDEKITFTGYPDEHTACGSVVPRVLVGGVNDETPVRAVKLDDAIILATDGGKERLRYLKLDIECAEYAVLGTCTTLELVDEVVGECHEAGRPLRIDVPGFKDFTMVELAAFLEGQGFKVTWRQTHTRPNLYLFWAKR